MKNNLFIYLMRLVLILIFSLFTINLLAQDSISTSSSKPIKITIIYPEMENDHQLQLNVSTHTPIFNLAQTNEYQATIVKPTSKGIYQISLALTQKQINAGVYLDIHELTTGKQIKNFLYPKFQILNNYFAQYGDSVIIKVKRKKTFGEGGNTTDNFNLSFQGTGALKYRLRTDVDSAKRSKNFARDYFNRDSTYNVWNSDNMTAHEIISTILKFRNQLDNQAYEELKIHTIYSIKATEALLVRTAVREHFKNASTEVRRKLAETFDVNDTIQWASFGIDALFNSYDFWAAQLEKYHAISLLKTGSSTLDSIPGILESIKKPAIREQLALLSANYYANAILDYQQYLKRISEFIYSVQGKTRITELNKLSAGQPAFNFSLTNQKGEKVRLSQFKGKVVFIDFWYTGCVNCTNYYVNVLSKLEEQLKNRGDIVFLSVSIDRNIDLWKKSVKSKLYTSDGATNLFTNGRGVENDVIDYYSVHSFPTPIIIDKNQRIFKMGDDLRDISNLTNSLLMAAK